MDSAHNAEPRKSFLNRQAQIRILFIIPEDDVEPRPVSLDQRTFQDEGLKLRAGDDGLHIGNLPDQKTGFWSQLRRFLKVRAHAIRQNASLPDVKDFAAIALQEVDAGNPREMVEFRSESISGHKVSVD